MTFRGTRTLALICRDVDCHTEAELLVLNDEFVCCPRGEWCQRHYEEEVAKRPREHATDLVYKLVRVERNAG